MNGGRFRNVAPLILDYVYICEKRGEVLNLPAFVELWTIANQIAEEKVAQDFEDVSQVTPALPLRDLGGKPPLVDLRPSP